MLAMDIVFPTNGVGSGTSCLPLNMAPASHGLVTHLR
jgi:hypothetical protein